MWRWLLGPLVILAGLTAWAYLEWCQHRVDFSVLFSDPAWPRPWPYPDRWLADWYRRIDAEYPVPPGHAKMCGEWYRLRGRLRACSLSTFVLVAAGVAILLWPPPGREASRWPSTRRGVAIGLVVGVAWTALIAYRAEGPPSVWLTLGVFATALALAGAVVGAVRDIPEVVGLCAGSWIVAVLGYLAAPEVSLDQLLGGDHPLPVSWCCQLLLGVDLSRHVVFGGSGFFWGTLVGVLHRLFRPAAIGENEGGGRALLRPLRLTL